MKTLLKLACCAMALGLSACSSDDDPMNIDGMTRYESLSSDQIMLTINGERYEYPYITFVDGDLESGTKGVTLRIYLGNAIQPEVYVAAKPSGDGLKLSGELALEGAYEMKLSGYFTDKPLSPSFPRNPQMTLDIDYRVTSPIAGTSYEIDKTQKPLQLDWNDASYIDFLGKHVLTTDVGKYAVDCINNEYAAKGGKVRLEFTEDGIKRTYVKASGSDEYEKVWETRYYMTDANTFAVNCDDDAEMYIYNTWFDRERPLWTHYSLKMRADLKSEGMMKLSFPELQYSFASKYLYLCMNEKGWPTYDIACLNLLVDEFKNLHIINYNLSQEDDFWHINCTKSL